jgi:hypothetical protein
MSLQDRLETLRSRHALLDEALEKETHRPMPDSCTIADLKRQKLRIKDEIVALQRQ